MIAFYFCVFVLFSIAAVVGNLKPHDIKIEMERSESIRAWTVRVCMCEAICLCTIGTGRFCPPPNIAITADTYSLFVIKLAKTDTRVLRSETPLPGACLI
jgi:hypothetical protein